MLRQDPVECLFSFICSSNNHISRIQGMVERLCHTLGPRLVTIQDTHYHDFPTLQALAGKTYRSNSAALTHTTRIIINTLQSITKVHVVHFTLWWCLITESLSAVL